MRVILANRFRHRRMVAAAMMTSTRAQNFDCECKLSFSPAVSSPNDHTRNMLLATSAITRSSRLLSTTASKHERIDNDILQQPAIKIVEVSPRDGLQNEPPPIVSVKDKIEFISKLDNAGCSNIEVGALVSPRLVPQMSGSSDILKALREKEHEKELLDTKVSRRPTYSVLVPNLEGLQHALVSGRGVIDEIAIFSATSDEFTKRNINATIDESIERFQVVIDHIQQDIDNGSNKPPLVRGYVSTVIACPYQGMIEPKQVAHVVERMLDLGCHEVSLGDTTGVGTPLSTRRMLDEVLNVAQPFQLAMHCHDTYGQALANILVGLEKEIYTIDSSVAGLGGCPYAKGASGNVATEDLLYMLHGMGLSTGIDLNKLLEAGKFICNALNNRPTQSKVARALDCK